MKRIVLFLFIAALAVGATAQPAARRKASTAKTAQQQKAGAASSASNGGLTTRARISFPTALTMPENVVWRRDIYRTLDLTQDANAGLYYPVEPIGRQMNLFTYIFRLVLTGNLQVYQYRLDGNESFDDKDKVVLKDLLDNYHIYYEEKNGKLNVENSDVPSAEVKRYFIKESSYYDQQSSSFNTKVLALCPVMMRDDDFGGEAQPYPLFWVKYDDLAPFLSRQTIMTSSLNNAATMGADDYFTLHKYQGKIYKTNNMLGKTLAQYCPTDSAMAHEQKRIEQELIDFEKNIWGDQARKDSLDSIAKVELNNKGKKVKKAKATRSSKEEKAEPAKKTKSAPAASSAPRVTVRRQRH